MPCQALIKISKRFSRINRYLSIALVLNLILVFPVLPESPPQKDQIGFADSVTGMAFVRVKGGCFQMGCGKWYWNRNCESDEKPVRRICLDTFFMGRYEVTQHQWQKVMGDNPSDGEACGPDCPVENVSWKDAQEFIKRLNALHKGKYRFRLPTEAEWEYACRSEGRPEMYCGGNQNERLAWFRVTSGGRLHPVGTKQPNGIGIYDMSGNVWEWCADFYGIYSLDAPERNPKGPSQGASRVIRGGSWGDHYSRFCRSAFRREYPPHLKSKFIGFRLVVTPLLNKKDGVK